MNKNERTYYYEKIIARNYNRDDVYKNPLSDIRFMSIIKGKLHNGNALDLGYGAGLYTMHLASAGMNVTSVDLVKSSLLIKRIENFDCSDRIQIVQCDIAEYDIVKKYDFILARNVLHYLGKEEVFQVLSRMISSTNDLGIHYFNVFSDIRRLNRKGEIVSFKGEANFSALEIMKYIKEIYSNWVLNIEVVSYSERDESGKFDYFTANNIIVTARNNRKTT